MPEPRFTLSDEADRLYSADSSFHRRTLFDTRGTVLRKLWAAEQKIAQHAEEIRRAQEQDRQKTQSRIENILTGTPEEA